MAEDGVLNFEDLKIATAPFVSHEWMFVGGLFIFIGSLGNVFEIWDIDTDAFLAAAGLVAMLEYAEDKRTRRK